MPSAVCLVLQPQTGAWLCMGKPSRDWGNYRPLSTPESEVPDAMETQKVHVSQFVYVRRWAVLAMTLEFGPEGSVRGFQTE